MKRLLAVCAVVLSLGACNDAAHRSAAPIPTKTVALMSSKGMSKSDPILVRVYKKESELEVWKKVNGRYAHLKTFPICRWSGQLGPKKREGDRQAPEGFYTVTPSQMNPNSSFHLSFDTGYPNAFDRANGRTGSHLMVHGDCSSSGCYAMTDEGISEVYAIAREAFAGGQRSFQLQAFPFRMTAQNMARHRQDPNIAFWRNLKQGADHFEVARLEPKVSVCRGEYSFNAGADGCREDQGAAAAVAQKATEDNREIASLVAGGAPSVRTVYSDGGQHSSFRPGATMFGGAGYTGRISRPEALAAGPREIPVEGDGAKASSASARKTDGRAGQASPAAAKPAMKAEQPSSKPKLASRTQP
ncbi:L,D-transpeptidase family protein [Enterovirga rhinocerotis]